MNDAFIHSLEQAVLRLTNSNQDGCKFINEVGWNRLDYNVGHSLSKQIGNWTAAQVGLAWKICDKYRNTQLADLGIPAYSNEAREKYQAERTEAEYRATAEYTVENGFQLAWDKPHLVHTENGPRMASNAYVPENHPFWKIWHKQKEQLQSIDYTVKKIKDTTVNPPIIKWRLTKWAPVGNTQPATTTVAPVDDDYNNCIDPAGLLPYQVASANRLIASLTRYKAALDASDVGTGKTYTALAVMKHLGLRPLIVCPKAVIPSWRKAALHFGIEIDVVNYELVRLGKTPHGCWLVGKKVFQWDGQLQALVFDEVHRCKSSTSQNGKLVIAAKKQAKFTLALSATAATNPTEMKALGYLLGLFSSPNEHWTWCQRNGCVPGHFGGLEFRGGSRVMQQLHGQIFPEHGTRIKVADLGDAFPETQIGVELLELNGATAKINAAYRVAEEAIREVEAKKQEDSTNHLTQILRARQISELGKIAAIQDKIEDSVEQGMSVFVCLNFRESIISLRDALLSSSGIGDVPVIWGQQSDAERQAAIEAFQADRARVILVQIASGGVGISLHDLNGTHPRLALISPTWSALDLRQALGRVHRAGGRSKSIQRILYAAGTIEEQVAAALESKLSRLDMLNDGDLSEVKIGIN